MKTKTGLYFQDPKYRLWDPIRDPSLRLYAPLYQLDGAAFMSKDAYGHLCTKYGPIWTPRGGDFDGLDDYIDTNEQDAFKFGTGDFTVSFWMKAKTWSGYTAPVSNSVFDAGWDGFHFERDDLAQYQNKIRWDVGGIYLRSITALTTDIWYFISGRRGSGIQYIDINGNNEGSQANTNDVDVNRNLLIGRNQDATYPRHFDGLIGEVLVYARCLSPGEDQHNYIATRWRYQ